MGVKRQGGDDELSGAVLRLRRGAGDRSARVAILTYRRCQGRENFIGLRPLNFSAGFLDKMSAWERNKAITRGCGGIIPPQGARGSNTLASKYFRRNSLTKRYLIRSGARF